MFEYRRREGMVSKSLLPKDCTVEHLYCMTDSLKYALKSMLACCPTYCTLKGAIADIKKNTNL